MQKNLEFAGGGSLGRAETAGDDVGDEIIFGADGSAGEAAEDGDLADVSERVGNGSLEESVDGAVEGRGGREDFVEPFERGEEAGGVGFPATDRGFVPLLVAFGD